MESGRDEAMEELAPIAVMQRMVESKLFPGFLLTVSRRNPTWHPTHNLLVTQKEYI